MKIAIVTIMAVFCLVAVSHAENPDSRPCISIGIGGFTGWGDYTYGYMDRDESGNGLWFSLNTVFPVSQNVSLWAGGGYSDYNHKGEHNYHYYSSESNWHAASFRTGIKLYFGKSINK